jgi:hypothetical protein
LGIIPSPNYDSRCIKRPMMDQAMRIIVWAGNYTQVC